MLKKVLVVDDSALIHQMYKMVLMRYRCEIVDALNGQDGLDKLEKHPDVSMMLVDINMPLMNGLEFIQKVKAAGKYDHIPIIIVAPKARRRTPARHCHRGQGLREEAFPAQRSDALIGKLFGGASA